MLPAKQLGVDPHATTTIVTEAGATVPVAVDENGDITYDVGSGSYSFVLSAA